MPQRNPAAGAATEIVLDAFARAIETLPEDAARTFIGRAYAEPVGCDSIAVTPPPSRDIYHDNGRAFGRRTRFFREVEGGIEWMYGVDYANGSTRWYAFHPGVGQSIDELKAGGMFLSRLDNGSGIAV